MTASAYSKPGLPNMGSSQVNYALSSLDSERAGNHQQQPMFKKHKVLPHPRKDTLAQHDVPRSLPQRYDLEFDARASQSSMSQNSSSSRRQRSTRLAGGPEPPPTPPAHSRKSSTSRSVNHSSPPETGSPLNSTDNVQARPPTTPTNQQTPPTPNLTPDHTPPGPTTRHAKPRPAVNDRIPSKVTIESRTESFRTAPENPYSSDDDDGRSTLRPNLSSAKTSQTTVRQIKAEAKPRPQAVGLGLGLESSPGEDLTPRTAREFNTFDGEWGNGGGSGSEVEEEWDYNLGRNVMVKKRRPGDKINGHKDEVIDDMSLTPTNATKALRSMSLQESPVVYPSPRRVFSEKIPAQHDPSASASSITTDYKRSSILSTRSTVSTVVEAILVETTPQRRRTLRHVRKQPALRESGSVYSPSSSAPTWASTSGSVATDSTRRRPSNPKLREAPRESYASNTTTNSISSRKARREVWKNGGIPVVVVPERQSSVKSNSREPSLRSTSSRRSKRSQSLGSAPLSQQSKGREYTNHAEPARRSRRVSETDGSSPGDQRTMDFPPVVPTRSSSLSAPTSRNASRTASLTAESLKAHSAFHAQQVQQALQKANGVLAKREESELRAEQGGSTRGAKQPKPKTSQALPEAQDRHLQPEVRIQRVSSVESGKFHEGQDFQQGHDFQGVHGSHDDHDDHRHRLSVDRYGDPFFGKRLSVQNTPFSQASADTNATSHHAEVSEAMAVNIYPHQNKSLVMVDHSAKPSESSSLDQYKSSDPETPTVRTDDGAENAIPVTPPQTFSMDDVDSPLRNPRAPPEPPAPSEPPAPAEPPAINFIPATPSGLTPMVEKERMLGNYFQMTGEKPQRPMSLLKRTLTRRRTSEYGPSPARPVGFLTRTFSLSRNIRMGEDGYLDGKRPALRRHSMIEDRPDENRLHPHWRPARFFESESEESDWDDEEGPDGRTYKYPPIDNRPQAPLRSLSQRMKRTFAILPARDHRDDDHYFATEEHDMPARRTIRRTPSGNLRVMQFRRSLESLQRVEPNDGRPYTAPGDSPKRFWGLANVPSWMVPRPALVLSADVIASKKRNDGTSGGFLPALGNRMNLTRRFSERRRQKRSQELRRMISGPREVRDGVGDVIRRNSYHR